MPDSHSLSYAVSCTDLADRALRRLGDVRYQQSVCCYAFALRSPVLRCGNVQGDAVRVAESCGTFLRLHYAMSGTDIAYVMCPVLTARRLLRIA
eukprot:898481-Rhodomonas_salina.1